MTDRKWYNKNFLLIALLVVIALFLISLGYQIKNPQILGQIVDLWTILLVSIGCSLISGIVALVTVGFWEQKRRDENNQDRELIYCIFTKDVVDTIMKQIMNASFIMREDLKIKIHLSKFEKGENLVSFHNHVKYKLKNPYNKIVKINITHSIDVLMPDYPAEFTELLVGPEDGLKKIDLATCRTYKEGAVVVNFPCDIPAENEILVEFKYNKILREAETFVWNSYLFLKGLNCKVSVDKSIFLNVTGELLTDGGKEFKKTKSTSWDYEWEADNKLFLPYQGVQIRWTPCPKKKSD